MNLGEAILLRRRALGLTQEQVAERLGVTPQAVYKWEKDLNTLFAYNTEPDGVELSALIERLSRLGMQKDGLDTAFAEARDALRKYPASAQLRLSLAVVLEGAMMAQDRKDEEKQREIEKMYRFAAASESWRRRLTASTGRRQNRIV